MRNWLSQRSEGDITVVSVKNGLTQARIGNHIDESGLRHIVTWRGCYAARMDQDRPAVGIICWGSVPSSEISVVYPMVVQAGMQITLGQGACAFHMGEAMPC